MIEVGIPYCDLKSVNFSAAEVHNALEYWVCENGHFVEKVKRGCIPLVIGIWEDC